MKLETTKDVVTTMKVFIIKDKDGNTKPTQVFTIRGYSKNNNTTK
jgi:hypothetical protein